MTDPRRPDWDAHRREAAEENYRDLIDAGVPDEEAVTRSGINPATVARRRQRGLQCDGSCGERERHPIHTEPLGL